MFESQGLKIRKRMSWFGSRRDEADPASNVGDLDFHVDVQQEEEEEDEDLTF